VILKKVCISNLDLQFSKESFDYYLGDWCRPITQTGAFVKHPIDSLHTLEACEGYAHSLTKRVCSSLSAYLNSHYEVEYSLRFWEIVTAAFVFNWVSSNYYKYLCLRNLQKIAPENSHFTFNFINHSHCKVQHQKHIDYMSRLEFEEMVHFEFQNLIKFFMPESLVVNSYDVSIPDVQTSVNSWPTNLKNSLRQFFSSGNNYFMGSIYGLNLLDRAKLNIRHIFALIPKFFEPRSIWSEVPAKLKVLESDLSKWGFVSENEFEEYLSKNIINLLPKNVTQGVPRQPVAMRTLFWVGNLELVDPGGVFYTARIVENGGQWISVQHGGAYGHLRTFGDAAAFEYFLTDYFVTWGWRTHGNYRVNSIPLPSPLLSKLKPYVMRDQKKILYVGTSSTYLPMRFDSYLAEIRLLDYKRIQLKFMQLLRKDLAPYLVFKDHVRHPNILPEFNQFLKSEGMSTTSQLAFKYAHESKVVIVDHCGTTLLQTLSMNVPTILFWNEKTCTLTDEALSDFEALEHVGIWYRNAEDAAIFLNQNFENIHAWWNSDQVQKAKNTFILKYALTSNDYQSVWMKFLNTFSTETRNVKACS